MDIPSDFDKDRLDATVSVPGGKQGEFGGIDFAIVLIHEGEVDA